MRVSTSSAWSTRGSLDRVIPLSSQSNSSSILRTKRGTPMVVGRDGSAEADWASMSTAITVRPLSSGPATMTWLVQASRPLFSTQTNPMIRSPDSSVVSTRKNSSEGAGDTRLPGTRSSSPCGPSTSPCFASDQRTIIPRTRSTTESRGSATVKVLRYPSILAPSSVTTGLATAPPGRRRRPGLRHLDKDVPPVPGGPRSGTAWAGAGGFGAHRQEGWRSDGPRATVLAVLCPSQGLNGRRHAHGPTRCPGPRPSPPWSRSG